MLLRIFWVGFWMLELRWVRWWSPVERSTGVGAVLSQADSDGKDHMRAGSYNHRSGITLQSKRSVWPLYGPWKCSTPTSINRSLGEWNRNEGVLEDGELEFFELAFECWDWGEWERWWGPVGHSTEVGAVQSQPDSDGKDHPIAYASRNLQPQERNYVTIENECLAIVWALKVFNTYLYGQKFAVQTDHQPLTRLHRMKNTNAWLTRWLLAIQPYSFMIAHRRGVSNGNADSLSRGPTDGGGVEMMEGQTECSHPSS